MSEISRDELRYMLEGRAGNSRMDLSKIKLKDMDLSGWKLSNIDFSWADFERVNFDGADMAEADISNVLCRACTFCNTILRDAVVCAATLRYCNLSGADIRGADMKCANLEYANLDGIQYNDRTQYFKLHCPESGAFVAWKQCMDHRMVQLLVPADAKRSSATLPTCRCSKAKVLSIKSIDYKESYDWARSFVDETFIYRIGEVAEVKDFNEDRWMDSTTGIHFFMTREEAIAY